MPVSYQCYSGGQPLYTDDEGVPLPLGLTWPLEEDVPTVDPFVLAQEAANTIVLPVPHVATSPPIEAGSYAQLPTYLSVANWDQTLTAEAVAGPVAVEVTANPVNQTWTIYDRYRGSSKTVECEGAGSSDPDAGGCEWLPEHSSDGQPNGNSWQDEATGEPCFYAEVIVQWEMIWTVGGAPGEPALDPGYAGGSTCLVVAEVQAIVDTG